MNKPTICRFVIATGDVAKSNGADECPAIITRVWSDDMVNLTLFPDAMPPRIATSVQLFATEAEARDHAPSTGAYWPPRV